MVPVSTYRFSILVVLDGYNVISSCRRERRERERERERRSGEIAIFPDDVRGISWRCRFQRTSLCQNRCANFSTPHFQEKSSLCRRRALIVTRSLFGKREDVLLAIPVRQHPKIKSPTRFTSDIHSRLTWTSLSATLEAKSYNCIYIASTHRHPNLEYDSVHHHIAALHPSATLLRGKYPNKIQL